MGSMRAAGAGLAFGLALAILLVPETAHAGKKDNESPQGTVRDEGKDSKWWKFWDREEPEEQRLIWKGWPEGGIQNRSVVNKKAFTTDVRRHSKAGARHTKAPHMAKKAKPKSNPRTAAPAGQKRVNKRYEIERFDRKAGTFRQGQAKKNRRHDLRREYMLRPRQTPKDETHSHKNSRFRRGK
jgi:hypothetical protein